MSCLYSLAFAESVFSQFSGKYKYSLDVALDAYSLVTPAQIKDWIRSEDQTHWVNFKKFVKMIERDYANVESWAEFDYYTIVKYFRSAARKKLHLSTIKTIDKDTYQGLLFEGKT